MLDFIRGEVISVAADGAIIAVGGVGLRVHMPTSDLAHMRGMVTIHTVLIVKEDDLQLYGFAAERSRHLFRSLNSVNGVGPKVALAVLSHHVPSELERILATGDVAALTSVSGVGKKIAERIALELRDKVLAPETVTISSAVAEVRDALSGMGFTSAEVQAAIASLPSDGDVNTLLRFALRSLGGKEPVST